VSGKTFVRRRGSTAIPNATVWDDRLSYVALGLLTVILSSPARKGGNGYRAYMKRGAGETAVRRALNELNDAGYRHQFSTRRGGQFVTDTIVSETPMTQAEAVAWHVEQLAQAEATVPAKSRRGTVPAKSRHGGGSDRAVENHAGLSTASLVPRDQGSLSSYLTKEPVNSKKADDPTPEMRWCHTCDRLRSEDQLTESGVCFNCLPEPVGASPEVGSGRALFRATVDALRASKAAQTTSGGQALSDQRKRA